MKLLTFDPATKYLGYAFFSVPTIVSDSNPGLGLQAFGLVRGGNSKDWSIRCDIMCSKISALIGSFKPNGVVCEFPTHMGSPKGVAAEARDSTLKVAYQVGQISVVWMMHAVGRKQPAASLDKVHPFLLVNPKTWKGQVPKKVTRMRVNADFGLKLKEGIEENISDAIGIGVFALGKLKREILYDVGGKERIDF